MCAKDKMEDKFKLTAPFGLSGDQPQAVEKLVRGFLEKDGTHQTLLGVTGSGKTFTMANVIARLNRPTLVLAHNKTLAAQLYSEFKEFFPENSVNYFVSYYDYYQPEAYIPASDVYIEKDASVNERIEKLRLMTTKALLERRDVVVELRDPEEVKRVRGVPITRADVPACYPCFDVVEPRLVTEIIAPEETLCPNMR